MSTYAAPEVYSTAQTLTTPAGTITFNAGSGDTYLHDPSRCSGLGLPSSRPAIDDRPQTHGSIVHPTLLAGRRVTLGGVVLPRTTDAFTGRDTMMVTLGTALVSILDANGTYTWANVAGTTFSITVRCEIVASFTGTVVKSYLFGLFAADATLV